MGEDQRFAVVSNSHIGIARPQVNSDGRTLVRNLLNELESDLIVRLHLRKDIILDFPELLRILTLN